MNAKKTQKEIPSRIIQTEPSRGRVYMEDNSPGCLIQTKVLNGISRKFNDKVSQRKFCGDINTDHWNKAIEYIGVTNKVYKTLNDATENINIEEKKSDLSTTTDKDNFFTPDDTDNEKGTIAWNPKTNLSFGKTTEKTRGKISPASVLYHEMGHATQWLSDKVLFGGIDASIIEAHNLANNEIPFNMEKNEPVRYRYEDASIETDNIPDKVNVHTSINPDDYNNAPDINNYKGLTLAETKAWSVVDKANAFLTKEELEKIAPLIENSDARKKYLVKRLKELPSPAPYKKREFKANFTSTNEYKVLYNVLVEVGIEMT